MVRRKSTKPKVDKRNGVKRESYNIPDSIDLELWEKEYRKFADKLDENGYRKPINETELVGWIRKKLDEVWMHCDTKLAFLEKMKVPDYDSESRRRAKWQCNICKQWFGKDAVQVDHRSGEHEFTKLEQLIEFADKRFMVGYDDLQILCIDDKKVGHEGCHEIKTYGERNGVSFEEAKVLKQVISIMKQNSGKDWLTERGITPAKNEKLRREQVCQMIQKNTKSS